MTNKEAAVLVLKGFEDYTNKYVISDRMREAFAMAIGKLMNGEEDNEDCCDEG